MQFVDIIIKETCRGSEDGIVVKTFKADPTPQPVETKLAGIFVAQKWAVVPVSGKPGPQENKVVAPQTKTVSIESKAAEKQPDKN